MLDIYNNINSNINLLTDSFNNIKLNIYIKDVYLKLKNVSNCDYITDKLLKLQVTDNTYMYIHIPGTTYIEGCLLQKDNIIIIDTLDYNIIKLYFHTNDLIKDINKLLSKQLNIHKSMLYKGFLDKSIIKEIHNNCIL